MPSRADDSFLPWLQTKLRQHGDEMCQCPLGLMTHFYANILVNSPSIVMCQCPLGLMTHFYHISEMGNLASTLTGVNALSG